MPGVERHWTRRRFLRLGAAGAAGLGLSSLRSGEGPAGSPPAEPVPPADYLTPPEEFGTVERGQPLPYTLPIEKRREVGLEPETWRLEVVPDLESGATVERPLSEPLGTALDWPALMDLARKHAVRYLKVMTCNNMGEPLGMGLWEGVPLREVVWLARPVENIRRVFYHGYHNDDPKQLFQSSLPVGRVLEDPPGEHPVILCYKLNGKLLSGKRGGPVRMLVPEAYGFKSVKWLKRVVLSNIFNANDTYAGGNNDIDSQMKTFARFVSPPTKARAGQPVPLGGVAQVGMSGLRKVQVWAHREDTPLPPDDPHFTRADWKDARILPPPQRWGGGLDGEKLAEPPLQFDPETGRPREWPLRYTLVHWTALLPGLEPGKHLLACRTIDLRGTAQPMPRPFPKSGRNAIQSVPLLVEG